MLRRSISRALGLLPRDGRLSFSQEGEDVLLQRIFEGKRRGFYIDVGAHHPTRFSNTFLFYLQGWRGINIDAMPGSMRAFEKSRPRDVNIECPISDREEELTYFMFNAPALNTFSEREAARKDGLGTYRIVERRQMRTETLASVLDKHLPNGQAIDFLSVDAEGADLQVLKSIDWARTRPEVVLAEELEADLEQVCSQSEIRTYLHDRGYRLFAKTLNTLFFRLRA